jgi:serine/threonine protein kinase
MAPEIYEGSSYSFPIDVYAYGVLLYICITGQDFFPGIQNAWGFGAKIRGGERPQIPAHVSQQWHELITRCWASEQAERPTFPDIVRWYGTSNFVNPSIDMARFREYQREIVPEDFWADEYSDFESLQPPTGPVLSQLELMRIEADNGDPYSANAYGCRLRDVLGLETDVVQAAEYFRRSAEGGDPQGMINWGN